MKTPDKAINLILNAEGIDQPSEWPGEESGVTIGYGYDLGYEENFAQDWGGYIPQSQIETLKIAIGKRGEAAHRIAHAFSAITIPKVAAFSVFMDCTLPRYEKMAAEAFPGIEKFPEIVFGALVSLVFNRGPSMKDDPKRPAMETRREMRAIREATQNYRDGHIELNEALKMIAQNLRSMKRLWTGKDLGGLLKRREAEAQLVEGAMQS